MFIPRKFKQENIDDLVQLMQQLIFKVVGMIV